ncbi:hypothetical protein AURDEDRAFT_164366 [Auricularia subglabra TFB-10046 SS5]|nr:hypothetical protein AURDEDRAFT_164366 [Auricularia subglabra TFB-10046 SS5]
MRLHSDRTTVNTVPSWSLTHPGLQAAIDAAAGRSSSSPHFFWSGRVLPATSNAHGVLPRAMELAKARGGSTLEIALADVPLPPYGDDDPDTEDIWQYASDAYTYASRGDAFFVGGESLRSGNVWEEYPQLKGNPNVRRVMQILVHNDSMGEPQ